MAALHYYALHYFLLHENKVTVTVVVAVICSHVVDYEYYCLLLYRLQSEVVHHFNYFRTTTTTTVRI